MVCFEFNHKILIHTKQIGLKYAFLASDMQSGISTITSKINITAKCVIVRKTAGNCSTLMKFDRSNKIDLCYYGQVNSLRLKSSVALKWATNTFGSNIYFAGDGTI